MKYYSQDKQDYIVDIIFNRKTGGYFVDIGAHNGITFSNTYFLEKERDWKGICIEPIPEVFGALVKNRKCIAINAAISTVESKMKFIRGKGYVEMLSGLVDFYDERHIERVERDIQKHGGSYEIIEVQAYTINNILAKHQANIIDYCNIDVEGAELDILKAIDFDTYTFKVFSVECNYGNSEVITFMNSKGFYLLCMSGADGIFLSKKAFSFFKNPAISGFYLKDRVKRSAFFKKAGKKFKRFL